MPRPRKFRRVMCMPKFKEFGPLEIENNNIDIIYMNVEEVESIRLMDLEGLDQVQCAEIMGVARSTFQRIYSDAKHKMADSLINGKKLKIEGGNYTLNKCTIVCNNCGEKWEESIDKLKSRSIICPNCGDTVDILCDNDAAMCKHCRRGNRNGWKWNNI